MTSRPRQSAAARAKEVISVQARADTGEKSDRGAMSSRRSGRVSGATVSREAPSSPGDDSHLSVTVKVPPNRLRQATREGRRRSDTFEGGEIVHGKRNRGAKKSYVVDSSPDDDDEEEEEEEEEDDEMEELGDEDAEGDDDMEVDADGDDDDAEGEEDAEGDIDMTPRPAKDARSAKPKLVARAVLSKTHHREEDEDEDEEEEEDDDDDDDLSEPADSDLGDETMGYGDETMADEDAEGEEIEVAGDEDIDEDEDEDEETTAVRRQAADGGSAGVLDSDDEDGSRYDTPDLAKMTKRQRARFEDVPQEYMKLSDEIQVKKVFTAEELSMRRQEMARRRRNLSEKRTEEVKMETINKLLKKQAPKINRKAAAEAADNNAARKANPVFIRWVSNKNGIHVAIPDEILQGPIGTVFSGRPALSSGKMVEEVA